MAIHDTEGLPRSRKEAKASGSQFYMSDCPCKNGHSAPRRTNNGSCLECEALPERRAASVVRYKAWLDASPENRAKHNVRSKEGQKIRRANNPDAVKAAQLRWLRSLTPEQRAERNALKRSWVELNREHVRAYDSARQKREWEEHPEKARMKGRLAASRRRASLRRAEGSGVTVDQVAAMLIEQNGICGIPGCGADISSEFDIDHKVPLSRGGSNLPDNLHLTCEPCNAQKHDLTVEEFVAKRTRRKAA